MSTLRFRECDRHGSLFAAFKAGLIAVMRSNGRSRRHPVRDASTKSTVTSPKLDV
jgi:hypothetical protein